MFTEQLQRIFGYTRFRENQAEIVQNVLANKNTLAVMTTGTGKSLCYQLPAVLQEGTAIVVSPLIALMKNQVDFLKSKQIEAVFLNSTLGKRKVEEVREKMIKEKLKLLYIAPETLNKKETIDFLKRIRLSFLAVDEAHCISEWGYDFRPEYSRLKNTIQQLGGLPVIALTATATLKVQQDILQKLNIPNAGLFKSSFVRPKFYYEIRAKKNTEKQIIRFLKEHSQDAGIIYCHSRKRVDELTKFLQANGVEATSYHAGLSNNSRIKSQDDFLNQKLRVIVATIAFGMGIDKPDVRFVIHYDAPKSMENYYQETGRAGRDGKKSTCIFFYDSQDIDKLKELNRSKGVWESENANLLLEEVRNFAHSAVCIRKQILNYFGEMYEGECGQCGNCATNRATYEGKVYLTKVLQGIHEADGRLNLLHLSHFLLGIPHPYIENNEFHMLPSFASGKDMLPSFASGKDKDIVNSFWRSVIRQAMLMGYIKRATIDDPFTITDRGRSFLAKPHALSFYEERSYDVTQRANNAEAHPDEELLQKLLDLREKESNKRGIKPYLIFKDHSLQAMAIQYPTTIGAVARLPDVGVPKAEKFGPPFISLVNEYILEHGISPPPEDIILKPNSAKISHRLHLIKQIDKKIDLENLAQLEKVTYIELIKELQNICYAGLRLNLDYYIDTILSKEEQEDIYQYCYQLDESNVERACDELAGDYDEDQIRLMYIKFFSEVAN